MARRCARWRLQTDGAYIPAGTGALDLESIYRTHIATMLQGSTDSQTHVVRNEAYQWLVLAALVLLAHGAHLAAPWNLRAHSIAAAETAVANPARAAALMLALSAWPRPLARSSPSRRQPLPLPLRRPTRPRPAHHRGGYDGPTDNARRQLSRAVSRKQSPTAEERILHRVPRTTEPWPSSDRSAAGRTVPQSGPA